MRDYTVDNPVFTDKISIVEEDDLVSAENDTAAVKQLIGNDLVLTARLDKIFGNADDGDALGFAEGLNAKNVVDAINQLFLQGNENKQKLVDNLIAMGIEASTSETWEELLNKVLDMTDTSGDTVTAAALLAGYTAHNAAGNKITGTLADKTGVADYSSEASLDAANSRLKLKVPAVAKYGIGNYLYATYTAIASLIGLTAAKLVKGNTILGVAGNNNNMDTSDGTAAAGDILTGKRACVKGSIITGTMANKANTTQDAPTTQDDTYTYLSIPANGYYNTDSKLRTANSNLPVRSAHGTGVVGSHVNLGFRPIFLLIGVVDRGDSYVVYDSIANIGRLVRFSSGTPFGSTNNISYLSDLSVDSTGFTFNYWSGTFEYFAFG